VVGEQVGERIGEQEQVGERLRKRPSRRFFATRRTIALVKACRSEQTNAASFYIPLAADSVTLVQRHGPLQGQTVLDVGGGPGFFAAAFTAVGARYISVDLQPIGTVCADAQSLPFRNGSIDVAFSSNVIEHVADPRRMLHEMLRVTKPGGLVFVCFTNWLGPLGGHETSPWHYLGGERAARHYERRHGVPPTNRYGVSLFPLSVGRVLRWVREAEQAGSAHTLAVFPRYHPAWAHSIVRVPGVREFLTANLTIALRVCSQSNSPAHATHAALTPAARSGSASHSFKTPETVSANVAPALTSQPVTPSRMASRRPSTS
jgi:SAM-dependent methyltransferase